MGKQWDNDSLTIVEQWLNNGKAVEKRLESDWKKITENREVENSEKRSENNGTTMVKQ